MSRYKLSEFPQDQERFGRILLGMDGDGKKIFFKKHSFMDTSAQNSKMDHFPSTFISLTKSAVASFGFIYSEVFPD